MSLIPHYSRPTTPLGTGFDITLPNALPIAVYGTGGGASPSDAFTGLGTAAALGDVASSGIILDDPGGTLGYMSDGIVGLHRMYFVESACPALDQNIWNGYVGIREYRRRAGITPVGAGRGVTVDLQDDNAILAFRVIRTSDGNRPRELADTRLLWLLGGVLNTVHDTGFVDHSLLQGLYMDANDYRGQYARDVLNDIALQTGANYFCAYNMGGSGSGEIEFAMFDDRTSTLFSSTLQVSNDPADVSYDAVTHPSSLIFRPHGGPEVYLRRDPSKTYAGVDVPYAGTSGTSGGSATRNSVYLVNTGTEYNYALRDGTAPSANIKTNTAARAQAQKFLADASTENDIGYVTVTVPNSMVNLIKAGMRLQMKMTHWPAPYNSWTYWRVNRRTISWSLPTDQVYDVAMELTPQTSPPLHQVVLASQGPSGAHGANLSNGVTTPIYWFGGLGGGMTLPMPVIAVDTDGYATRISDATNTNDAGDSFGAVGVVQSVTIPAGLGGLYQVTWENFYIGLSAYSLAPWYDPSSILGGPWAYQQVWFPGGAGRKSAPYPVSGAGSGAGSCLMTDGWFQVDLLVNGLIATSSENLPVSVYSSVPGGNQYTNGDTHWSGYVNLVPGDVVSMQITASGQVYNALVNSLGIAAYGEQQGFLALVLVRPSS